MPQAQWAESIFWLYTILVDEERFGMNARGLMKELEMKGIQTRPLWQPMHRSPVHCHAEASPCETADWLHTKALSLPCSVGLTESDQDHVLACIASAAHSQ